MPAGQRHRPVIGTLQDVAREHGIDVETARRWARSRRIVEAGTYSPPGGRTEKLYRLAERRAG